jgi:hypothetical protein
MRYLAFFLFLISHSVIAQSVKTYIPPQAFEYKEIIHSELGTFFPNIPEYNYVHALIEHESCISLRHSRCWNPKSQLKSAREEGAGLSMITRAYRSDGSIRFDSLTDMRNQYRHELKEASWNTIYQRPDIQIRLLVLMSRDNYKKLYNINNDYERLAMTDAAYNGGLGGLLKERRACGLSKGCDPQYWFGHVEKYCMKSKKAIYGDRSPCSINRHHVFDVLHTRLPKYKLQYFKPGDL